LSREKELGGILKGFGSGAKALFFSVLKIIPGNEFGSHDPYLLIGGGSNHLKVTYSVPYPILPNFPKTLHEWF
jgi:hypothetical protein